MPAPISASMPSSPEAPPTAIYPSAPRRTSVASMDTRSPASSVRASTGLSVGGAADAEAASAESPPPAATLLTMRSCAWSDDDGDEGAVDDFASPFAATEAASAVTLSSTPS